MSDYKLTNCINKAGTQPLDMLDMYYHYKLCKPMINIIAVTLYVSMVTSWCHPVSMWSLSGVTLYIEVSKQLRIMNCIKPGCKH